MEHGGIPIPKKTEISNIYYAVVPLSEFFGNLHEDYLVHKTKLYRDINNIVCLNYTVPRNDNGIVFMVVDINRDYKASSNQLLYGGYKPPAQLSIEAFTFNCNNPIFTDRKMRPSSIYSILEGELNNFYNNIVKDMQEELLSRTGNSEEKIQIRNQLIQEMSKYIKQYRTV